jgi:hypothetical protein
MINIKDIEEFAATIAVEHMLPLHEAQLFT